MPLLTQPTQLTDLLKEDHRRFKQLFRQFERGDVQDKKAAIEEALPLIQKHDKIEHRYLYPYAKEISDDACELAMKCEEAHHVVNLVLAELKVLPYNERYFAKFSELCDALRQHMEEEENELFPIFDRSDVDQEELAEKAMRVRASSFVMPEMLVRNGRGVGAAALGLGALVGLTVWAVKKFKS